WRSRKDFAFDLSAIISQCTHFTLGGPSIGQSFQVDTLEPLAASTKLTHLSLQIPKYRFADQLEQSASYRLLEMPGDGIGAILIGIIDQEAANRVQSLAIRMYAKYGWMQDEVFYSDLVAKFSQISSLRIQFPTRVSMLFLGLRGISSS